MQKQHRGSLAALVIGHAATQHIDGLFCERLFCHWIFRSTSTGRDHAVRLDLAQIAAARLERGVGPHRLSVLIRDAGAEAGNISRSPP